MPAFKFGSGIPSSATAAMMVDGKVIGRVDAAKLKPILAEVTK